MKRIVSVILVALCLSSICLLFAGCSSDENVMTLEKFNKIEVGMTYEEVVEIVGCEGELTSEASVGDHHSAIYTWKGKGSVGANAVITFSNGEVSAKAQAGLK